MSTDLMIKSEYLPNALPELGRFVLVGREKLTAVRAEIRAIDKVHLAQEVRDQKMDEARMLSEALLDAEVKLGEMTKNIPRSVGGDRKSNQYQHDSAVGLIQPKHEIIRELGFTPKQVERFEKLADNQDLVELAKAQARENDDIPTRTQVLTMAAIRQKRFQADMAQIDADKKAADLFSKMVYGVLTFDDSDGMLRAAIRGTTKALASEYIQNLNDAAKKLDGIKTQLIRIEREGVKRWDE